MTLLSEKSRTVKSVDFFLLDGVQNLGLFCVKLQFNLEPKSDEVDKWIEASDCRG